MAVLVLALATTSCLQLGAQQTAEEKPTTPSPQNEDPEKSVSPGEASPLRTLSGEVVYRSGGELTRPRVIKSPDPKYPKSAKKEHTEGTVVLWLIVNSQGSPEQIKVKKSLGHGLDRSAFDAVSRWKFTPATKDGRAVTVAINVEVNFQLY